MNKEVLIYVIENDRVLFAKKTHRVGIGKWHTFGGKVRRLQSLWSSAQDHVWRATGGVKHLRWRGPSDRGGIWIDIPDLQLITTVDVYKRDRSFFGHPDTQVTIFRANHFSGKAVPTIEMNDHTWFPLEEIPFESAMLHNHCIAFLYGDLNESAVMNWVRLDEREHIVKSSPLPRKRVISMA